MPLPLSLERVVGKPWTSWVSLASSSSGESFTTRNGDSHSRRLATLTTTDLVDPTHSRSLNKSEMAIFGSCPASELLVLIPCSYCGDKFKFSALAEHIRLRHDGAKKPLVKLITPEKKKSPTLLRTKGKHGRALKEKIGIESAGDSSNDKTQDWTKTGKDSDGSNHRNEREISVTSVLPQFMLKHSVGESVKESSKNRESKGKTKKSKLPEIMTIEGATIDKTPVKRDCVVELTSIQRGKLKIENVSKKAKLEPNLVVVDVQCEVETPPELVPVVELKKKKGQKATNMRGGRVYDPDIHCGVIGKGNTRPCTRLLLCKQHSITLRKAVKGRSQSFDFLVAAIQKEKELLRNKVLDVEVVEVEVTKSPKSEPKSVQYSETSKLRLPVSIKNPNLWSQLQAPVAEVPAVEVRQPLTSALVCRVLKEERPWRPLKPPSSAPVKPRGEARDLTYEGLLLSGYRKSCGLLSTSYNVPRTNFKDAKKLRLTASKRGYLLYLNGDSHKLNDGRKKCYDFLKLPDKNVVSSMPSVAAQVNPLKSSGAKSGEVASKPLNLFGPINGTKVLPLSVVPPQPNCVDGKPVEKAADSSTPTKAGLLSGDVVRLKSPRTHFFTPSGPLSLAVDRSSQLNCKSLHPKLQFLPNSALTTAGLVYLQRTLKTAY